MFLAGEGIDDLLEDTRNLVNATGVGDTACTLGHVFQGGEIGLGVARQPNRIDRGLLAIVSTLNDRVFSRFAARLTPKLVFIDTIGK